MNTSFTATEMNKREAELETERLHSRLRWFFAKYAPEDKREAAEFHADFMLIVQEVHKDAGRMTQHVLMNAMAAAQPMSILMDKK